MEQVMNLIPQCLMKPTYKFLRELASVQDIRAKKIAKE